jgi:hypothetical protein
MIEQYLPNNNEKSYNAVLQKILDLNRPVVGIASVGKITPYFHTQVHCILVWTTFCRDTHFGLLSLYS